MTGITVVIPVKNRVPALTDCVRSVLASYRTLGNACPLEILVIDDHSSDDPAQALTWCPEVVVHANHGTGPGAARNAGVDRAQYSIVAFIDSDCLADTRWLARVIANLESGALAVQGNPSLFRKDKNPRLGRCEEALYSGMFASYVSGMQCTQIDTRNFAIRRALREHLGHNLFPSEMTRAQAEARVCGNALVRAGVQIRYDPSMAVLHEDPTSLLAAMRQKLRHGTGRVHVWERLPSCRQLLTRYYLDPIARFKVPAWYVVPTHTAFLCGFLLARWRIK